MLVRIYAQNPAPKEIRKVVDTLERGGLIVCPTDSAYVCACSLRSAGGMERLRRWNGADPERPSVVCSSIGQASEYCRIDNPTFRILKRNVPGAFTFLLEASSRTPDRVLARRRTIGIRIPENPIPRAIVDGLGVPLATVPLGADLPDPEYRIDPELIDELFGGRADLIVDGGRGETTPTTVVDLTGAEPVLVREGKGSLRY